jgi:hypothetical protein
MDGEGKYEYLPPVQPPINPAYKTQKERVSGQTAAPQVASHEEQDEQDV